MQKGSTLKAGDRVEQKGYDGTFVVTGEWRGYAVVESAAGTSHKAPLDELTLVAAQPAVELADRGALLLVTTAHPSMSQHTLDGAMHPNLGRLIQPRHTSSIEKTAAAGIPWAADNDCFQGLDEAAYTRMLDRIAGLAGCLFVTVPDVVGDAEATFELFGRWIGELERRELPAALVAQDGLELELDRVEWDRIAAVFIGGTTEWKEGPHAAAIAREAAARGKWVHWGRVNTRRRFDLIVATGAASSFDGSKFARFRNTYLDAGLAWALETSNRKDVPECLDTPGSSTLEPTTKPTRRSSPRSSSARSATSVTIPPSRSRSVSAGSTPSSTASTMNSAQLELALDVVRTRAAV